MDKNKDVEWREIPGFEGRYNCSDNGDIYSLVSGIILSATENNHGYMQVSLHKNGKQNQLIVHRIIAMVFLGECPIGLQVNHRDGDKANNCVSNLEYVTPAENIAHATRSGLRDNRGEKNPSSKLTAVNVSSIRDLLDSDEFNQVQIGRMFGVEKSTISCIKLGKTWKKKNE